MLDAVLKRAIPYYRRKGLLDETPLRLRSCGRQGRAARRCDFPARSWPTPQGKRLFIADSNHNRIVVARLDGTLVDDRSARARIGRADGDYATAQFKQPQGMALDGQTLYVADTENHLIRKVDLAPSG